MERLACHLISLNLLHFGILAQMAQVKIIILLACLKHSHLYTSALNPTIDYYPPLDPEDEELLADPSASTGTYTNGHVSSTTPLPAHVPWLRKTEYIARERSKPHAVIEDPYVLSVMAT